MEVLVVVLAVALVACLGFLIFGKGTPAPAPALVARKEAEHKERSQAPAELERRKKELAEEKAKVHELAGEIKTLKKKLFDQKEGEKGQRDILKARQESERTASVQLESVRIELAGALAEIDRMRASGPLSRRPQAPVAAAPAAPVAANVEAETRAPEAAPAPVAKPQRVIRELNDADREKMERLETTAKQERTRAIELDKEVKRLKNKTETQARIHNVTKAELELNKDKFKALEKRMNRTLLETDLIRRALRDLEAKTGSHPARVALTSEEQAASDKQVDEQFAKEAEARAAAEKAAEAAAQAAAPASDEPSSSETTSMPPPASEPSQPVARADQANGEDETRSAAADGDRRAISDPEV